MVENGKPKILFVFDHKREDLWRDGLWAALNLLENDGFEIIKLNLHDKQLSANTYFHGLDIPSCDFALGWGGFNSRADKFLKRWAMHIPGATKRGLCIAGNAFPPDSIASYNILFYETNWYYPQIADHRNIFHAFGINSAIYRKRSIERRLYDWIGVGSFSLWKRWELMTGKAGIKLVVGEYQKDNRRESNQIIDYLVANGVMVSDMVTPEDLALMYNHAACCYIPADINGGGERAVLEARACGIRVEVERDNAKLQELVHGQIYDEKYYYQQLKKGILSVL